MREDVIKILESLRPDVDFSTTAALVDDGVLGSLDIVELVSMLNDEFVVDISADDLLPENFNSIDAMVALIESK